MNSQISQYPLHQHIGFQFGGVAEKLDKWRSVTLRNSGMPAEVHELPGNTPLKL